MFELSTSYKISTFPIYLHYPIHEKLKPVKEKDNKISLIHSPSVYCFVGGSLWDSHDKYFQVGSDASIYVMGYSKIGFYMDVFDVIADALLSAFPVISIGIRSGIVYNPGFSNNYGYPIGNNLGFYIGIKLCSGNGY